MRWPTRCVSPWSAHWPTATWPCTSSSTSSTPPSPSQHLGVLRSARLVRTHREGREVRYHLTDEHVAHIVADAVQHAVEHGD